MVKYQNIDFSPEKADREVALWPGWPWYLRQKTISGGE